MDIFGNILSIAFGASIGSFSGATIWRIRARDLSHNITQIKKDKSELKKIGFLSQTKITQDRSRCLSCKHQLSAWDMIPILSWLWLRGKCRYCKKPIGKFEFWIEIFTALYFFLSFTFWPYGFDGSYQISMFVLWLIIGTCLIIIGGYDAKWYEIPARLMYATIGLCIVWATLVAYNNGLGLITLYSIVGSVAILSGVYLLIFFISKGKWIGFGDVELGLALALLLADWKLSFIALFMANFIGTAIVLPGLLSKKISRNNSMPFGPLFIAGFIVAYFWGNQITILIFG